MKLHGHGEPRPLLIEQLILNGNQTACTKWMIMNLLYGAAVLYECYLSETWMIEEISNDWWKMRRTISHAGVSAVLNLRWVTAENVKLPISYQQLRMKALTVHHSDMFTWYKHHCISLLARTVHNTWSISCRLTYCLSNQKRMYCTYMGIQWVMFIVVMLYVTYSKWMYFT